jgi:Ca-activated chloride channel family protein
MEFVDSRYLLGLIVILPLFFLMRKSSNSFERYFDKKLFKKLYQHKGSIPKLARDLLFISALALSIVAFARPIIQKGEIKVKSSDIDLIVGFDISQSMFANDIYPDRFSFAKLKFDNLLNDLNDARVGVIGFSSKAFLISPLTKDFSTLKYLVKNMKLDYVSLKGTSIMSALEVTNNLLDKSKKKALLLFSDGGDKKDYSKEIAYAKEHSINLFVYAIGSQKGGVIKTKDGILKDKNGDIVVVKRNDAIKELAIKSGGAYLEGSLKNNDISALAKSIKDRFKNRDKKEHTIKDTKELFIYPLSLAMLLFVLSFSSLPTTRRRRDV